MKLTSILTGVVYSSCMSLDEIGNCEQTQADRINRCDSDDYQCLCSEHRAALQCYNLCQTDTDIKGRAERQQSRITIYCNYVSQSIGASATSTSTQSSKPTSTISDNVKNTKTGKNKSSIEPNQNGARSIANINSDSSNDPNYKVGLFLGVLAAAIII